MSEVPVTAKPHDHGDEVDAAKYRYDGDKVPAAVPERPLAKSELKDKIYHGVLLNSDTREMFQKNYDAYVRLVGRKPSMIGTFHFPLSAGKNVPERRFIERLQIADSVSGGALPFMKMALADWKTPGPFFSADKILAGKYDQYFINLANMSKEFGKPFLLSVNHEMNGDWYQYSELYKKEPTDWTADKYIECWRRMHRIFQEQGATKVAFAWCPGVNARKLREYDSVNSYKAYYPGDEYVDWIGASIYNDVNHFNLDNLAKSYPNKPLMIAEWGTEPHRGQWYVPKPYPGDAKWVAMSMELFVKRYPNLKATAWFQWGDKCNVERVPEQVNVYRKGIAGPNFINAE